MKIAKRWWMFWLTAAMYATIGMCTALTSAVSQMTDEQWEQMLTHPVYTSRSFWILVPTTILGGFSQVRALMNGEYQKAKESPSTP